MNVKAIRAAIADAVDGLAVGNTTLQARGHVFTGDPPFAYCADTSGTYHETLEDGGSLVVTLRLLTSRAEDQSGQEMLDDLLASSGATSVKVALEADDTLGGVCSDLTVTGFTGYQPYEVAGVEYYGAEVDVVILA